MEYPKESELVLGGFILPDITKPENLGEIGHEAFAKLGETIGNWTKNFFDSYKKEIETAKLPKDITLEFGVKLKIEAGIVKIINAGTEADLRLKMSWSNTQD